MKNLKRIMMLIIVTTFMMGMSAVSVMAATTTSASPSGGTICTTTLITVYVAGSTSYYKWDNGDWISTSNGAKIYAPSTGTHSLYLYTYDGRNYNTNYASPYATYTVQEADTTPPSISVSPSSGSTVTAGSSITISASDVSGIQGIGYYWDGNTSSSKSVTGQSSISATVPSTAGSHTLTVAAADNSGNSSGYKSYNYTVPVPTLAAPTGLKVTGTTSSSVSLSWSAVSGANDYYIYYGNAIAHTANTDTSYTVTGLSPGTYSFYVKAYNGAYSAASSTVSATTAPSAPSTPTGLTVGKITENHIRIGWDPSNATSYKVYRSLSANGTYSYIGPEKYKDNTIVIYDDNNLSSSTTYYYKVSAVNSSGQESSQSAYVYGTTLAAADTTPPSISLSPSSGSTVTAGSSITISASDTSGIQGIGYYWDGNTSSSKSVTGQSSISATVPSAAGSHTLTVAATDNSGNSSGYKSYNYTVQAATVSVTGVTLNKTSTTITAGSTETLIATVAPSNATNKNVSWSSSNTSVATVSNGVVTAKAEGSTVITATSAENSSIKATCNVTVNKEASVTIEGPIYMVSQDSQFIIFVGGEYTGSCYLDGTQLPNLVATKNTGYTRLEGKLTGEGLQLITIGSSTKPINFYVIPRPTSTSIAKVRFER